MPKISALPLAVTPTGDDVAVIVQGGVTKKTPLSAFPLPDLVTEALAAKQPLDSDLTAYAGAADAAARRTLIGAETAGAAATVQGNLDTHTADTAAHGATASNTASRIVTRNASGTFTISGIQLDTAAAPTSATGLIRWNDVDKTGEIVTEGGVVLQLGQEETVYVRNNSGVALVEGDAVYITGSSGQRTTVAKVQANSSLAQKTIGLVTTTGGIADNAFGFVTLAGLVRDLDTDAYLEGTELWLSPTTAGALTATQPTADTHRVVRIGYVVRSHATQGMIMVATHYHGTVLSNALMEAEGAAAGRTALDISAANTPNTPAGNIAATTVQAAINELDSEKTTAAAALAAADAADLSATAALIEREGLRFDGTAGAVIGNGGIPAVGTGDFTLFGCATWASGATPVLINNSSGGRPYFKNSGTAISLWTGAAEHVISGSLSLVAGLPVMWAYTRSGGTWSSYINGSLVNSGSDSTNYTAGWNQLGAEGGTNYLTGSMSRTGAANYALTAAEIAALTRRGLVTLPEQRGGSMVALNTGTWTALNSTQSVNTATAQTFTASPTAGGVGNTIAVVGGRPKRFRFSVTHAGITSGFSLTGLESSPSYGGYELSYSLPTAAGTYSFEYTTASSSTAVEFRIIHAGSGIATAFTAISIIPLGTLFEQDSGQRNAGYMVRDTSGNNADLILPATGVSVIDPAMRGMIRFTTSTSGNQQIGGTQVIIPTNARISSWVINSSGTPNVTLGNVSAGAQYRASAAVAVGDNQITLLTPFTTTGNLWVNSSTTATLKHTIQWEYIQ